MMQGSDCDDDAPLIEMRRATVWRGRTCVFRDFDLAIPRHQQVAVLGPNGSGKTTLLKVVNREIYPVASTPAAVRILGRDNWNVWELRSHIGIVSHDLQAHYRPTTTGLHVVLSGFQSSIGVHGALARRITPRQIRRAHALLEELGVADLADTALGHMSTGQQRRCLLARALVHDPHTLIFDEPTAGLDLAGSFDYLTRVRQLVAAGKTIVLVSHALNEIPPAVDRVILLRAGKIVADGAKDRVLNEMNLLATFGVAMRIARIDGYYLAYPPSA